MSLTKKTIIALVVGLAAGAFVARLGTPSLLRIAEGVEPLGTLWVNAIRMTVIPLVAASLIAALAAAPDARLIGRVGGIALALYLGLLAVTAVLTVVSSRPLLATINVDGWTGPSAIEQAAGVGATIAVVPSFLEWLVALVPANPVKAAADGALLPLIVFSVAFGAAVTRIGGESRALLQRFFSSIADVMLRLMQWILELAPIGVFALALPLAARVGVGAAGAVVIYIVLVSVLCILVGLLLYPLAATLGRVPITSFARACAQAQAVAATSRSSLASLPAMIAGAEKHLDLDPAISRFFLSLSASTFRIGAVIAQISGVLFLAHLYRVELANATLLGIAVTSILTSFSVPGVAGGSIIVMLPVLVAAGIPPAGVGILLGMDAIPDIFRTAVNVTGHMTTATIASRFASAPVQEGVAPSAAA